jgi:hypothetical protein
MSNKTSKKRLEKSSATMPRRNRDHLAALSEHKRMVVHLRGEMYVVPPGSAPKRFVDVSTMWCGKEGNMMTKLYQYMSDNGVRAYLKDRTKKVVADGLKIMFVANIFERASPLNNM